MDINIAPPTGVVLIDGVRVELNLSELAKTVQGIHWDGSIGNVTFWDPSTRFITGNEELTSFEKYQYIVDEFNVQRQLDIEKQSIENAKWISENILPNAYRKRDYLLQSSDWTQLPDVNLTVEQKAAWATYRQFIRDVPSQAGFPDNIDWGTPPA